MYKNRLAQEETYRKNLNGDYDIEKSITVYEAYIELARDKSGEVIKNKNGSDRYYPIDDLSIVKLDADLKLKKVRDNLYKKIYEVNGDFVEKVERDGKRFYYVVNEDRIEELKKDTAVVNRGDYYQIPNEIGMIIVDEKDIEHPRVIGVRKFETEDHQAEATKVAKGFRPKPQVK